MFLAVKKECLTYTIRWLIGSNEIQYCVFKPSKVSSTAVHKMVTLTFLPKDVLPFKIHFVSQRLGQINYVYTQSPWTFGLVLYDRACKNFFPKYFDYQYFVIKVVFLDNYTDLHSTSHSPDFQLQGRETLIY